MHLHLRLLHKIFVTILGQHALLAPACRVQDLVDGLAYSGDIRQGHIFSFSISGSTGGGVHRDPGSKRGPSGGRGFQGGGEADQEPAGGIDVQWGEELSNCNCLLIILLIYDAQGPRRIDHKDRVLTLEVSQQ